MLTSPPVSPRAEILELPRFDLDELDVKYGDPLPSGAERRRSSEQAASTGESCGRSLKWEPIHVGAGTVAGICTAASYGFSALKGALFGALGTLSVRIPVRLMKRVSNAVISNVPMLDGPKLSVLEEIRKMIKADAVRERNEKLLIGGGIFLGAAVGGTGALIPSSLQGPQTMSISFLAGSVMATGCAVWKAVRKIKNNDSDETRHNALVEVVTSVASTAMALFVTITSAALKD